MTFSEILPYVAHPNELGVLLFVILCWIRTLPLCHFKDHGHFSQNQSIILSFMGNEAVTAIFDPSIRVFEIAAALIAQRIERTIAEQTAEAFRICTFVAGEIFTFLILIKIVMSHFATSIEQVPGVFIWR